MNYILIGMSFLAGASCMYIYVKWRYAIPKSLVDHVEEGIEAKRDVAIATNQNVILRTAFDESLEYLDDEEREQLQKFIDALIDEYDDFDLGGMELKIRKK